jgi:fatty acid desaturase
MATTRLSLVAALFVVLNTLLFIGPRLLADYPVTWGLLWLVAILTTQSYWALIHEAMHGHLGLTSRASFRYGRLLCWFFPAPFRALRAGHLSHHALNRSRLDRSEIYDPACTPRWRAMLLYYARLLIGLYLLEVALTLLVWAPRAVLKTLLARAGDGLRQVFERELLAPAALREMRVDSTAIVAIVALAGWCHGSAAPVLLALLLVRGVIVSFSDNAFHYGTALDDRHAALNLAAAPWYARLVLHFNLHAVHHRHPALPWWELPRAFAASGAKYDSAWWRQSLRQLRGPVPLAACANGNVCRTSDN